MAQSRSARQTIREGAELARVVGHLGDVPRALADSLAMGLSLCIMGTAEQVGRCQTNDIGSWSPTFAQEYEFTTGHLGAVRVFGVEAVLLQPALACQVMRRQIEAGVVVRLGRLGDEQEYARMEGELLGVVTLRRLPGSPWEIFFDAPRPRPRRIKRSVWVPRWAVQDARSLVDFCRSRIR